MFLIAGVLIQFVSVHFVHPVPRGPLASADPSKSFRVVTLKLKLPCIKKVKLFVTSPELEFTNHKNS